MKKYTQLSKEDRQSLEILWLNKVPISTIAQRLNCHRSTIYRELQRNKVEGFYKYHIANAKAQSRRHQKRGCKIDKNPDLRDLIITGLVDRHYKPKTIAALITRETEYSICHETIYQYIYKNSDQKLYQYLVKGQNHRFKHCTRKNQRLKSIEPHLITHRPQEINDRQIAGHWEADSIVFTETRKIAVITLVERVSRVVILLKVNCRSAAETTEKIIDIFKKLPKQARQSITTDQGGEFADYKSPERLLSCKIFVCEAGHPWQKGTNENTNGILRRYLPRNFNLENLTQELLNELASELNNTPRACLEYKSPRIVFLEHFKNCDKIVNPGFRYMKTDPEYFISGWLRSNKTNFNGR